MNTRTQWTVNHCSALNQTQSYGALPVSEAEQYEQSSQTLNCRDISCVSFTGTSAWACSVCFLSRPAPASITLLGVSRAPKSNKPTNLGVELRRPRPLRTRLFTRHFTSWKEGRRETVAGNGIMVLQDGLFVWCLISERTRYENVSFVLHSVQGAEELERHARCEICFLVSACLFLRSCTISSFPFALS